MPDAGTGTLPGGDLTDPENDGVDGAATGWGQRLEVLRFDGNGADFPAPPPYRWFRYRVQAHGNALLQTNELELFGLPVQVIPFMPAKSTMATARLLSPGAHPSRSPPLPAACIRARFVLRLSKRTAAYNAWPRNEIPEI